ncbi:ubiquitin carboxyl-terminal hydrolase 3-like [Contarinia nasturtii]|uniref:ubiquitin carboxyl-terminal hydrolase 3-like n=1 Tax=Contarinia nasturtii TaxID=265458 RepID=UPI0012D3AE5B|nr:ubiquitin carboxyl-terminal hydrolase 3-like [Contarinia nasturtii]XP_031623556.1 ubiquitin carboxyl-terminal hydrolase 3-like [Contarinia nasturtii]
MECPHLRDSVKVNRDFIKNIKCALSTNSGNRASTELSSSGGVLWRCLECTSDKENWMCLNCGQVLCGRYENGHALHHSTLNTQHNVCLNTLNFSVYCYKCDDFVINGKHLLDNLREEFKDDDSSSEASNSLDESSSIKSSKGSASTSSSDSGWYDESTPGVSQTGRRLRPRKRTNSNTNNENGNESPTKKKLMRKVIGLRNLGNTCFMNSVLQSLNNIEEFSLYFNTLPSLETKAQQQQQKRFYYSRSQKDNVGDANVAEELRKVLINLSQGGDGSKAISPESLFLVIWKVVPQFRGHRQHDAHEFLRYMLDRLHTELQCVTIPADSNSGTHKTTNKDWNGSEGSSLSTSEPNSTSFRNRSSIVTNIFGGTLQSEVRCLICGMESKKHDPFLDLSLDIPEKFYKETDADGRPVCNIADCLSSFTEVEELAETELYYCNSCKCKQKSTKRFWIRRLPNVLCLHIKRFRWNNFFRTKIDLRIKFPIKSLDMSQYVLNNVPETRRSNLNNHVYDLAAVIVHHGNGSSCGHYTSFANNNGTWLHFNDQTVKEVEMSTVAECKPYMLFYSRRDSNSST